MSGLQPGAPAPDFSLAPAPAPERVILSELRGETVVLLFVPLAFSGSCTKELCGVRDDWSAWSGLGARVFGITVDSPFVTRRWTEELGLAFPVLSDFNREVSRAYDVLYEDFWGLRDVPKRSVFVIDPSGVVAFAWVSEDADVMPPFEEVLAAVRVASGKG